MNLRSSFTSSFGPSHRKQRKARHAASRLELETLEDRSLLSCYTISGHVYNDLNNNGLRDSGEAGIVSNSLELRNASGQVVGTAQTDSNGYYEFTTDSTIPATATLTRSASVNATPTDWTQSLPVDPFDPSLGTLTSIDIIDSGSFTSQIKVESLDASSSTITATVAGTLTLSGPGLSGLVTNLSANKSFNAGPFDGVIDFGGSSGNDFGAQVAQGSKTISLTSSADLAAFQGSSRVQFTQTAKASTSASGAGNLVTQTNTTASSQVSVVYHYTPNNCLKPGNYVIKQIVQPNGFFTGRESSAGVILPRAVGARTIPVTLVASDLPDNDFGQLAPATIAGVVYVDKNNSGQYVSSDDPIANATINLTGTTDLGPVTASVITKFDGTYQFTNLRPGTYSVAEVQPAAFLNGKISLGSLGGSVGSDQLGGVVLGSGVNATNYNFGELLPSSLSGSVYLDANNNGKLDPGEAGIGGVAITLTGTDDTGSITQTATTGSDGRYSFSRLRPGSYTVRETQPAGYAHGRETVGSLGGSSSKNVISTVTMPMGVQGTDYNFGELLPASIAGFVYQDFNNNGTREIGEPGIGNVIVMLTGTDDLNTAVRVTQTTATDGSYKFTSLRPGTYVLTESQPSNFVDGKDTAGSLGGSKPAKNQLGGILVAMGQAGVEYDFGELPPGSISGFVYIDGNNNGIKEDGPNGESGLPSVFITLSGANDLGQTVTQQVLTGPDGSYKFSNLRPGIYAVSDTPPDAYLPGKLTVGSVGGVIGGNQLAGIAINSGTNGVQYNFGLLVKPGAPGVIYSEYGIRQIAALAAPMLPVLGKSQLLSHSSDGTYTPQVMDNAYFVQGLYQKMLGRVGDSAGMLFWTAKLMDGTSRAEVARAFYRSAEYRTQQIKDYYNEFLNRPMDQVDAGGIQVFLNQFSLGRSEVDVQVAIITDRSLEFTDGNPSNQAFVQRLYERVLHRGAGANEIASWVAKLNGGTSRADVARGFLNSQERFANVVVSSAYNDVLQRAPDPAGRDFWVAQLLQGKQNRESLIVAFLASNEFLAFTQDPQHRA